jgi:hypothetical protein
MRPSPPSEPTSTSPKFEPMMFSASMMLSPSPGTPSSGLPSMEATTPAAERE